MRKPDALWDDADALEAALYRYVHGEMDAAERAAFEAYLASDAQATARLKAWARARGATRYLRMRLAGDVLRPELYLSPVVEGYGALVLPAAHGLRRYAAGASHWATKRFLQTASDDGRLLLTLRRESGATWMLYARYAVEGRWQLLGDEYALIVTPHDPLDPPQCLLCVMIDMDETVRRRYLGWFMPDPDAPSCYVARLRLPDWRHKVAHARLLFGVVDADAIRWLSDAERRASCDAAVDPEAQQRWRAWTNSASDG